jgi:mRNA-degrading endonuclease RelE of RelBE toxin-antitoxin system
MTSDRFEISFTPSAQRDLRRLPEKVATAVVEFIFGGLAENPYRVGRELHLDLAGHYSARRGDFRVVYRILQDSRTAVVVYIDHRSDVYLPRGSTTRRT